MGLQLYQKNLLEKLKESLGAVLPIIGIVLVLCFSIAPIPNSVLMTFVVGAVLLIIGMMFFTLGAEMAMTPMGERIGTKLTNTRKISVVIVLCFILGFIITISEPDLQVLAEQVPSIPNYTLIIAVATGVGIFLVAAVLRMLFGIPLAHMLLILSEGGPEHPVHRPPPADADADIGRQIVNFYHLRYGAGAPDDRHRTAPCARTRPGAPAAGQGRCRRLLEQPAVLGRAKISPRTD